MKERRKLHSVCSLIKQMLCQLIKLMFSGMPRPVCLAKIKFNINSLNMLNCFNPLGQIYPLLAALPGFDH
jgi:hypothetical protein